MQKKKKISCAVIIRLVQSILTRINKKFHHNIYNLAELEQYNRDTVFVDIIQVQLNLSGTQSMSI